MMFGPLKEYEYAIMKIPFKM